MMLLLMRLKVLTVRWQIGIKRSRAQSIPDARGLAIMQYQDDTQEAGL